MFFRKTGILILIYVCAQNSCGIWKIFPVHHQNREHILLFGTKTWSKNSIFVFAKNIRPRSVMKGYIKYTCKYFIMFKENLWPNFVSEHPMIFSMFCHQTFVNVCGQTWLRHVYGIYITSASSVKLYSILSQQFANVAPSPVKDLTIVCLMLQKLFYIPALWIWDLQPTVWILMSWSKIISPALSLFTTNLSISFWHCPSWAVVWAYATDHDTWDEDHHLQLHKTVILNPSIVIHIHKIVPMYLRSRVRTTFVCTPSTTLRNSLQQNSLLCCHKLSKETESTMECPSY